MFIFQILIQLLRKMWGFLVENLVLDFKDQLVQAFSPSAWLLRKLLITWIKPHCMCILCVNYSGEYKGKKRYRALLPLKQLMLGASAARYGFSHIQPSSIFSSIAIFSANRPTYRKMPTFLLQNQFRIPCWLCLLSLSNTALIQSFCFCFFMLFFFNKQRGNKASFFKKITSHAWQTCHDFRTAYQSRPV